MVARARTHVSNLAHFLKTPLVGAGQRGRAEAQRRAAGRQVKRQVNTMRRQVDHYLARARAAGSLDVLGNRTQVTPVLDDLARVLARIHAERGIAIDVDCAAELSFRGERQDLEEMAGNLIDNACKWAASRVRVAAQRDGGRLVLTVDDDGPGLSPRSAPRSARGAKGWTKACPARAWAWPSCAILPSFTGDFSPWTPAPWAGCWPGWNLPAVQLKTTETGR